MIQIEYIRTKKHGVFINLRTPLADGTFEVRCAGVLWLEVPLVGE